MAEELNTKDKEYIHKAEMLLKSVDKIFPSYRQLIMRSFLQGIFVALGTTIGFSIVIAIVTFMLSQLKLIPTFQYIIDRTHIEQVIPDER